MNKVNANNSHLLNDSLKTDLSYLDIFDKVINLRLTTVDKSGTQKDVYVIRSDFEVYYPELQKSVTMGDINVLKTLSGGIIRRCSYKPSIKVQYKRVSLTSSVAVDIYINNFYALSQNGEMIQNFNNADNKLAKVELSMGYFGQFKSVFKGTGGTPATGFEFSEFGFREADTAFGITCIKASNVEYVTLDKLPPDSVLHIHCYIGNTFSPIKERDTLPVKYQELTESKLAFKTDGIEAGGYLNKVYFESITRNYFKEGALDKLTSAKINATRDPVTGLFSESDAKKYGLPVYLSNGMKEYSKKLENNFAKDKSGNKVLPVLTFPSVWAGTAEDRMNRISNTLGLEGVIHAYMECFEGYFVFLKEELADIEAMLSSSDMKTKFAGTSFKKYWNNNIPAVNDVTKNSLITIVAPFFGFINPFEHVKFKPRYALSGVVQYFSGIQNKVMDFIVLWQNISFATVDDVNECILACTSVSEGAE